MFLFSKKSVGIDIADHTIEIVELIKSAGKLKVSSMGRIKLDSGIVERGRVKDENKLAQAIKTVLSQSKPHPILTKKIIFGLPESQVYTHVFTIGAHDKKQRNSFVLKEALSNIPLKKEELLFDYKVLFEDKVKVEILLVAASKEIVSEWYKFFKKLGLEAVFDIESLAIFRGVTISSPKEPVCIVDIGFATTNISIFDKKGLRYVYSINIAGDIFTKEIAQTMNIKPEEAEKKKLELGLSDKNNQIFSVLIKQLEKVKDEIKTGIDYFQLKTSQKISGVIFVGGSSQLKGLEDYLKMNLNLPIIIGGLALSQNKIPLEYAEAAGLALRGIDNRWKNDPGFP